jgi:proliferating cell nuclear antigen
MKAEDTGDVVSFMFEAPQQDRFADFELKLMDIDAESLGIPDTEYAAK